jgi:hypothetical protein
VYFQPKIEDKFLLLKIELTVYISCPNVFLVIIFHTTTG